jgi:hypothetical protein
MTEQDAKKQVEDVINAMAFAMSAGVSVKVGTVRDNLTAIITQIYADKK